MENILKIRTLTERFMEGETTLDEEQLLYDYYRRADLPADLAALRPMMLGMESIGTAAEAAQAAQRNTGRRLGAWPKAAAAAAAAVLLVSGGALLLHRQQMQNECVAYIYGKKCTDPNVVMQELHQNIAAMSADDTDVEGQLNDLFGIN